MDPIETSPGANSRRLKIPGMARVTGLGGVFYERAILTLSAPGISATLAFHIMTASRSRIGRQIPIGRRCDLGALRLRHDVLRLRQTASHGELPRRRRRNRSSLISSSSAASNGAVDSSARTRSARPNSSCLRSRSSSRRKPSIARRLATAMSQAPGFTGNPECGHCSSAATSAS